MALQLIDIQQNNGRLSWERRLLGQLALALERFALFSLAGGVFSIVFFFPNWYDGDSGEYLLPAVAIIVVFFSGVFAASRYLRSEKWTVDPENRILVYHTHLPIKGEEQYKIEFSDIKQIDIDLDSFPAKSRISLKLGDEGVSRTLLEGRVIHSQIREVADKLERLIEDTSGAPPVKRES